MSTLLAIDDRPDNLLSLSALLKNTIPGCQVVTALSGRGVGMDVVSNEIKQIGGSIEIDSEEGIGCTFIIRIPFTLAVMQAISVMAGEHP